MARKKRVGNKRITKGPRKGQTVLAYLYSDGSWTEIKNRRGATAQRRKAARAAGLRDKQGHTAEDRSRIRRKNPKAQARYAARLRANQNKRAAASKAKTKRAAKTKRKR